MRSELFIERLRTKFNLKKFFSINIIEKFFNFRDILAIIQFKIEKSKFFRFNNKTLEYFWHSYNYARLGERTIEIPIIRSYFEETGIRDCLEIGNVTNHYYAYFQELIDSKIVVDKYEKGYGVINKDIIDYFSDRKFDFIFSISTFEHMDSDRGKNIDYICNGFKYGSSAAHNIVHCINNLLNPKGLFIITIPLEFTRESDDLVLSNKFLRKDLLKVDSLKIYFFKHITELKWKEINFNEVKAAKLNPGKPWDFTYYVAIIEIKK